MAWGEAHEAAGVAAGAPISTPEERVAGAIIAAAERAAQGILQAAQEAAKVIIDGANAVPTALSTPAPHQLDPEEIARIIENMPSINQQGPGIDYGGPTLDFDPRVDQLQDDYGNVIAPTWQQPGGDESVSVPDPTRQSFDVIGVGQEMVPGIPRLDLPLSQ